MLLSLHNPVYNTIIVFVFTMILIYIIKPNIVYDNNKQQFRQFGTNNGKTLLPIHVIGILLAILIYFFFNYIQHDKSTNLHVKKQNDTDKQIFTDAQKYYLQNLHLQMQIQNLNQQIQQSKNNILPNTLSII